MSQQLEALESSLLQEEVMDQLLERPGKRYTDVQELVSDLKVELKRDERSTSADDTHNNNNNNNDDDDDDDNDNDDERFSQERWRSNVSKPASEQRTINTVHGRGPQTGPKGVISDHREYERQEYQRWLNENVEINQRIAKQSFTARTVREDEIDESIEKQLQNGSSVDEIVRATRREANNTNRSRTTKNNNNNTSSNANDNDNGGDHDDDDDDDDFLSQYRRKRLAELQSLQQLPTFGTLDEIDTDRYYEILHDTARDIITVIHIQDDRLVACRRLTARLRELATRHKQIRFRIATADAFGDESFDASALPMLLIYRKGKLLESVFNVNRVLGETFETRDVEVLLAAAGAMRIADVQDKD